MEKTLRITKNTFSLILREALNKGALFLLMIMVGRLLGKAALGRYSLALVLSQIFFFGTELGLNTVVIREVARESSLAKKALINIGIIRVILGLVTILLIWGTALVLKAQGETLFTIMLCAASFFFVNITNLYTSIFRALEKMELDLIIAIVRTALFLPLAVWLLLKGAGLIHIFYAFLASNILALFAAQLIFLRQIGWPRWEMDPAFCKRQFVNTVPLWLSQLLGIAYLKLSPILLFKMKGEEAVGLYNAAFIVVDIFWIASACFISAVFPIISRLSVISMPEAKKEYAGFLRVLFSVFIPAGICVIFAALPVIRLFYGDKFIETVPLFRFLAVAAMLVVFDLYNATTLIGIGKQHILPVINGAGLLLNFILNVFFIAQFDYSGAAYALIASELLVVCWSSMALKKYLLKGRARPYAAAAGTN